MMKKALQILATTTALAGLSLPALAAPGDRGGNDPNYWVRLGAERFEGGMDRESRFAGWGGRSVDRIGLRAANGFARCVRVQATFGNGHTRDLDTSALSRMVPGHTYRIDLPGGDRNIVDLRLKCRALGQYAVSIGIFARK
jgi:hypothetical protein